MAKPAKILGESQIIDTKNDGDTIRLWESHREQAMLWRALSLLQIPTTFIAIIFAMWMWNSRSITLNVPAKPLPGQYSLDELPDAQLIEFATSFLNLVTTYQPAIARRQFTKAREMLREPYLGQFDSEMINNELKAIETTMRTQIFFVDPTRTEVTRNGETVSVSMTGERLKIIAGKQMPSVQTTFTVSMSTLPRNELNEYGLAVSDLTFEYAKGP